MNIHWSVHSLLCGNAAAIHFADESGLLSEPASSDEHGSKETGCLSGLLSTIAGHF